MHGGHDLGGKQGLGPINPEPESEEPVFHSDWERRVFALTIATGMLGKWNIDQSRYARERQHPIDYLKHSYYENWYEGVSKLLIENGLVSKEELLGESTAQPASPDIRVPSQDDAKKILTSGGPTLMQLDIEPKFNIGEKIRVVKSYTYGHTRAPAYVQGCIGEIAIQHGGHVFPDSNARGQLAGEHLYAVCFSSRELWGTEHDNSEVFIDLWEPYLVAV
ncbi:MAG: nitrile hydratase subunit beta [Pseudomonadales bacterium]|nr:nitrile hydratase subunit beta [Pseudomonadales bacterium]